MSRIPLKIKKERIIKFIVDYHTLFDLVPALIIGTVVRYFSNRYFAAITFIGSYWILLIIVNTFLFRKNNITMGIYLRDTFILVVIILIFFSSTYLYPSDEHNFMSDNGTSKNLTMLDALYFSTVTLTTLGYGDILPHGNFRIFAMAEVFSGVLLMGFFLAGMSQFYNKNN